MEDWKKTLTDILQQEVTQEAMAAGNKTPEQEAVDFIEQELSKAREEGRMSAINELKGAFSKVFYKSGELWFDYLFEDGDTEAEEDAKAVVEGYWEDILSELKDNK